MLDPKIFFLNTIIADSHSAHCSQSVYEWIDKHSERMKIYYLPTYSPDLNPTELLNQDVKSNSVGRKRAYNLKELMTNVRSYLKSRQRNPEIVKNYFKGQHVRYALL